MNNKIPTSLFDVPRLAVWNAHEQYLEGSPSGAFLVVSSKKLPEQAHTALMNSAIALGYKGNITFLTLNPTNTTPNQNVSLAESELPPLNVATEQTTEAHPTDNNSASSATSNPDSPLSGKRLFHVIESLDPLCIVVTDHHAIEIVAQAFRARLEIEVPTTLLGHYCCCFNDFARMLSQEKTKQQAWALLKSFSQHV